MKRTSTGDNANPRKGPPSKKQRSWIAEEKRKENKATQGTTHVVYIYHETMASLNLEEFERLRNLVMEKGVSSKIT